MGKRLVSLLPSGPTGPRTPAGKAKSKFNALKHGILSTAAVLETESAEEYSQVVSELVEVFAPTGKLEEALVEKIATTLWRYRRLLRAEAAKIDRANVLSQRTFADQVKDARLANAFFGEGGSLQKAILAHDDAGLFSGIRLIKQVRERILEDGLDWDRERKDLEDLFGEKYREVFQGGEEQAGGPKSVAGEIVAKQLTGFIDTLEPVAQSDAERRRKLERFRDAAVLVPEEKDCDHLIRYEAHLDRVLDRALGQLERLQRMRLGQPVLPPVRVEVSR